MRPTILLLLSLIFLLPFNTFGQKTFTLEGATIDSETKESIPYVFFTWSSGGLKQISNKDGTFSLIGREGLDSILNINSLGYETVTMHRSEIDSVITLTPITLTDTSSDTAATSMIDSALSHIQDNYFSDSHLIYGFYQEELYHNNKMIQYGEGILKSLKSGYKNNPNFDSAYYFQENDLCTLVKGFQSSTEENDGEKPILSKSKYLPKIADPLTALRSPLLAENIENMEISRAGRINNAQEQISLIDFSVTGMNESVNGTIFIGDSSHIIYRVKMTEKFGNAMTDTIQLSGVYLRKSDIHYDFYKGKMAMSMAIVTEESMDSKSPTPYLSRSIYYTSDVQDNLPDSINRESLLRADQDVNPYLPIDQSIAFKNLVMIPRSSQAIKAIGKGKSINFRKEKLDDILLFAQKEQKLLFFFAYENNNAPSKRMQDQTLRNQEIVHHLTTNFICKSINLSQIPDHQIIYAADLQFVPSVVIMTPLGQVLEVVDGFITPQILINKIKSYDPLSIPSLFYAYDTKDGSDRSKLEAAYLDLFVQLAEMKHPQAKNFIDVYIQKNKEWETPSAKNIIFHYLVGKESRRFDKMFLNDLDYYQMVFGEKEVLLKISELAEQKVYLKNIKDHEEYYDFVEDHVPTAADSLYGNFLLNYYYRVLPDERKYISSLLSQFNKYKNTSWASTRQHFITAAYIAEEDIELNNVLETLKLYKDNSIDHEYLDIMSVILYRQGKEEEALKMIQKIQSLALAKGIKYNVALARLQKKDVPKD